MTSSPKTNLGFDSGDYPALYQAANKASVDAQQAYIHSVKWYLFLLTVAALVPSFITYTRWAALLAAVIFLATTGLLLLQAFRRFDRTWYNGRAVAESVKTRTWRFMMRAEPYDDAPSLPAVSRAFCEDLRAILEQNRQLAPQIGGEASLKDQISEAMKRIRSLDAAARLEFYRHERIDEQRRWYAVKYAANRRGERVWFSIMIGLNVLAIVLLIIQFGEPQLAWVPVQVVIVAAAGALSWLQIKRYQDNASAYSLTAHEIGLIRQFTSAALSDSELSDFVKDAENAFSREHTQWQARRDT